MGALLFESRIRHVSTKLQTQALVILTALIGFPVSAQLSPTGFETPCTGSYFLDTGLQLR